MIVLIYTQNAFCLFLSSSLFLSSTIYPDTVLLVFTVPYVASCLIRSPHPPMIPSWEYLEKYWRNQHNLFTPQNKNENTYMNEFDNRNSRNQNESNFDHMSDTSYSTITRKIPGYASDELIKEWTAIYYALIEEIDTQVGLLLNTLDSNDSAYDDDGYIKNNTLIVFTSDHGEYRKPPLYFYSSFIYCYNINTHNIILLYTLSLIFFHLYIL